MRKILTVTMATLLLAGCGKKGHEATVYKTQDGSYYTQDQTGQWLLLYVLMNSQNQAVSSSSSIPAGTWGKAPNPPSPSAIKSAQTTKEEIEEEPETEENSEAAESSEGSDESSGDSSSDAGGGE